MLGHTSIKTTQIYARITDQKVSADMAQLAEKLESTARKAAAIPVSERLKAAKAAKLAADLRDAGISPTLN